MPDLTQPTEAKSTTRRVPISVVIITLNAGAVLADCLASVAWAAEILVVDSGSTDNTVALAEAAGARVLQQIWLGFGPQKQWGVEQARYDWVFCLDSDERVTPALAASIATWLTQPFDPEKTLARCARRNRFLGRYLRHGEGYPDWNTRLFHRAYGYWTDLPVHEHVRSRQPVSCLATLEGDLLHHSQENLPDYLRKQERYTQLQAMLMYAKMRDLPLVKRLWRLGVTVLKVLLAGPVRFLRFYIFRLGLLDGWPGFLHIAIGSWFTAVKYAKLLRLLKRAS
ncbi:glycosyltransferase family 2 protein [Parvibium lacunae]|uniref:Glycosyltransferase family 2 protein n=2 Tax=Parvibium lacunae TaxID=1888893 RepID=A0A368L210_9BURK|nr:glycosyltransferase family 2 protein [Parvibium lacunae]